MNQLTIPVTATVNSGDTLIVVVVADQNAKDTAITVTDDAGNGSYHEDAESLSKASVRLDVFSRPIANQLTQTSGHVMVSLPDKVVAKAVSVIDVTGLLRPVPNDSSATNTSKGDASSTAASVTSNKTASDPVLIIGSIAASGQKTITLDSTVTPNPLTTALPEVQTTGTNAADVSLLPEYLLATAPPYKAKDNYTAGATFDSMAEWAGAVVAYKAQPPTAIDDPSYTDGQGQTLTVTDATKGVLANDIPGGAGDFTTLTAMKVTDPQNGSLTLNNDGTFTYKPDTTFVGKDSFQYEAVDKQDGNLVSAPAKVTITVGKQPVANPDFYPATPGSLRAGQQLPINDPKQGVLANDIPGAPGDTLTAVADTQPAHGKVVLNPDGTFTYSPIDTNVVTDSFTYHDLDTKDGLVSASATVTITITPPALPIVPSPVTIVANTMTNPLMIGVATGDIGYITEFQVTNIPPGSTLTAGARTLNNNDFINLTEASTGLIFKPPAGTGTFSFNVSEATPSFDGKTTVIGPSAPVTVTTAAAPIANPNSYTVRAGQSTDAVPPLAGILANILTNPPADTPGVVGDPLTAVLVSGPTQSGATLTLNPDGTFDYKLNKTMFTDTSDVTDSFTYKDEETYQNPPGAAFSSPATVTITTKPPSLPVVPPPTNINQNTSSPPLIIGVNPDDASYGITGFQVSNIPGDSTLNVFHGRMLKNGDIITVAEGLTGLVFTPPTGVVTPPSRSFNVGEVATVNGLRIFGATTPVTISVQSVADLGITFSPPSPAVASLGMPLTYTATVTNAGPSDATGVLFTDTLPANVVLDSVVIQVGATTKPLVPVPTTNPFTVDFAALGLTVPAGGAATVTIVVTPQGKAVGGVLQNSATVDHRLNTQVDPSPDPTPNTDSVTAPLSNTLVVTKESDVPDDKNSLRYIINQLNDVLPGVPVTIAFDPAVKIIKLNSPLPAITHPVTINGGDATLPPSVMIDGTSVLAGAPGQPNALLTIDVGTQTGNTVVQSLAFKTSTADAVIRITSGTGVEAINDVVTGTSQAGDGILVDNKATMTTIVADTVSGVQNGVVIETAGNIVGKPGQSNSIYGNGGDGVLITGTTATGNKVQGNVIGSNDPKAGNLVGISIEAGASQNIIGGTKDDTADAALALGNVIANNSGAHNSGGGVLVKSGNGNTIRGNSIYLNDMMGIGVTPAANNMIPAPMISGASAFSRDQLTFDVSFLAMLSESAGYKLANNYPFVVDFYVSPASDSITSTTQGRLFTPLASITVHSGDSVAPPSFPSTVVKPDEFVTAVVTDKDGNSSGFSNPFKITNGLVVTTAQDYDPNDPLAKPIPGSLRKVLSDVNNSFTDTDTSSPIVIFDIKDPSPPLDQVWSIKLTAPLTIKHSVVIDSTIGDPRAESGLPPRIVLDGADKLTSALVFNAMNQGQSVVRGVDVVNFSSAGIMVNRIHGLTLAGNYIGVDKNKNAAANKAQGILVENADNVTLGGPAATDGNIIAGNGGDGIEIDTHLVSAGPAPSFTLQSNFIGYVGLVGGTPAVVPNNGDGIDVEIKADGADSTYLAPVLTAAGNTIAGNTGYGVRLVWTAPVNVSGTGSTISGNMIGIGTDAMGHLVALGNKKGGIFVDAASNVTLGGPTNADGNSIGGNLGDSSDTLQGNGIAVHNGSNILISHNVIGNSGTATTLGNARDGVFVEPSSKVVITFNQVTGNPGNGIDLLSAMGSQVGGNVITGNGGDGVKVQGSASVVVGTFVDSMHNSIPGNAIGHNTGNGVEITGAASTGAMILGNTISGNQGNGIAVSNGSTILISNNTVSNSGTKTVPGDGIFVDPSSGVFITFNQVSGNTGNGIDLVNAMGSKVGGNFIGVSLAGAGGASLQNGGDGVRVKDSPSVVVGTFVDSLSNNIPGNVIGNNGVNGVEIIGAGSTGVTVQGNFIGTSPDGTATLGNVGDGVLIGDKNATTVLPLGTMVLSNLIKNSSQGNGVEVQWAAVVQLLGNTIAANHSADGVLLQNAADAVVGKAANPGGNVIGTNGMNGVEVVDSPRAMIANNKIGTDSTGNISQTNGGDGVLVRVVKSNSDSATIQNNLVSANGGFGIDLQDANGAIVSGNTVGTDLQGVVTLGNPNGNAKGGVSITGPTQQVSGVQVTNNTISGNNGMGLAANNTMGLLVSGNGIGVDASKTFAIKNKGDGVNLNSAPQSQILGNFVGGNDGNGLVLTGSDGSIVKGNWIGTGMGGVAVLPNGADGIAVTDSSSVTIGAQSMNQSDWNVIVNNAGSGIDVTSTSTTTPIIRLTIAGNRIGISPTINGSLARGNTLDGVKLTGSVQGAMILGDMIGANQQNGVEIAGGASATLHGNFVGTDESFTHALGNVLVGVAVTGSADASHPSTATIGADGGTAAGGSGNVIVANRGGGVEIDSATGSVVGNFIGTNRDFSMGLGNIGAGLIVNGADGVQILANIIGGNAGDGISANAATNLTVAGNGIGTSLDGSKTLGNGMQGVEVTGPTRNVTIAGNQIWANVQDGVKLTGVSAIAGDISVTVSGNTIGNTTIGNKSDGVGVESTTGNFVVQNNTITGNLGNGVAVRSTTGMFTVQNNMVQMNRQDGMLLDGVSRPSGTPEVVSANNITSNGANGVEITGASSYITLSGKNVITNNSGRGVVIRGTASSITVGGPAPDGNMIASNVSDGVELLGDLSGSAVQNNTVQNNTISDNGGSGVFLSGAGGAVQNNTISGNTITHSGGSGVFLSGANSAVQNNPISGNTITLSGGSGVFLSGSLVMSNGNIERNTIGGPVRPDAPNTLANRGGGVTILSAGTGNVLNVNVIEGNDNNGVLISVTKGTTLTGNWIGNDGMMAYPNSGVGLYIADSSKTVADSNVIGGNGSHGVLITGVSSTGNSLTNNYIGVTKTSDVTKMSAPLPNTLSGIVIVGVTTGKADASNMIQGNVIAANQSHGIFIIQGAAGAGSPAPTMVQANYIGTDKYSTTGIGNKGDGVLIFESSNNIVGGNGGVGGKPCNTIAGNSQSGVEIIGVPGVPAKNNMVMSNYIGTYKGDTTGNLDNTLHGVAVSGTTAVGNMIGAKTSGNVIAANHGHGVFVNYATGTVISSNTIGDLTNNALGNTLDGVSLNNDQGTKVLDDNKIGHNHVDGVGLFQSTGAMLTGNHIESNLRNGVRVEENSMGNFIGLAGSPPNVITNNPVNGIEIRTASTLNSVRNNLIGIDEHGNARPNGVGVLLNNVSGNYVGQKGSPDQGANTISDNKTYGVEILGLSGNNVVQNNFIGTASDGNALKTRAANQLVGVYILNSSSNMINGNVVSGNGQPGVSGAGVEIIGASATGNTLTGNMIGSNRNGTAPILLNGQTDPTLYSLAVRQNAGVWINNAPGNFVGPVNNVGLGNTILGNYIGVLVSGALSTNEQIVGKNQIGPSSPENVDGSNTDGLGNFVGVSLGNFVAPSTASLDSASMDFILNNQIDRNVSVGIAILGTQATNNMVMGNMIALNGGYGDRPDANTVKVTPRLKGKEIFGSGVYIESALANTVTGNTLKENVLVDVYLFNISVPPRATPNVIKGNVIFGQNHPEGRPNPFWNGQYGILLFNSADNLPGVEPESQNSIRGHFIADFREFTGPTNTPVPRVT
jgi:parallel beta-helix repeat protein